MPGHLVTPVPWAHMQNVHLDAARESTVCHRQKEVRPVLILLAMLNPRQSTPGEFSHQHFIQEFLHCKASEVNCIRAVLSKWHAVWAVNQLFAKTQAELLDVSAGVRKSMCAWVRCDGFQLLRDAINLLAWTSKKQILRKLKIRAGQGELELKHFSVLSQKNNENQIRLQSLSFPNLYYSPLF